MTVSIVQDEEGEEASKQHPSGRIINLKNNSYLSNIKIHACRSHLCYCAAFLTLTSLYINFLFDYSCLIEVGLYLGFY